MISTKRAKRDSFFRPRGIRLYVIKPLIHGIDALQLEDSEFDLIKYPERGTCLFKCGNERYLLQVKAPDYKAKQFGEAGGR